MGRLENHKRKQYTVTVTSVIVVLVILIVFIFTVGLKLLLNTSAFIATIGTKSANTEPLTKNDNFIGTISIDNIPTATNSASFMVSGSVLNFDKVAFYLNGEKVKESSLTSSDTFTEQVDGLTKGSNEFYALGKSADTKTTKKTQLFTILYKSDKPKLDIKSPSDNSKTDNQDLTVSGTTDKEVFVRVNDGPVVVDVQGNFQTSVKLQSGSNTIKIEAEDNAGNVEAKILTVTYQKD